MTRYPYLWRRLRFSLLQLPPACSRESPQALAPSEWVFSQAELMLRGSHRLVWRSESGLSLQVQNRLLCCSNKRYRKDINNSTKYGNRVQELVTTYWLVLLTGSFLGLSTFGTTIGPEVLSSLATRPELVMAPLSGPDWTDGAGLAVEVAAECRMRFSR